MIYCQLMVTRKHRHLQLSEVLSLNSNRWMIVVLVKPKIMNLKNLVTEIQLGKCIYLCIIFYFLICSKLNLLKNEKGDVCEFSTSSLDGNLIIWDIKNILNTQNFSNLAI